ncbi:hypothetical protein LIER_39226 [Lithospermum erythrorhizon]|uniref:Uncharacterized protein n=1 Tax=Lithospermum erythrorhizon TaxID=34254 RepID=A0AAV3QCI2_LITER
MMDRITHGACYDEDTAMDEDLGPIGFDNDVSIQEEDFYEDFDQSNELVDHYCEDTGTSRPVEYNKHVHRDNSILIPDMVFSSANEFRGLIRSYSFRKKLVKVNYLARKYINKVRRNPSISVANFIEDVKDDITVDISLNTSFWAIKVAGYLLFGNESQKFAKLSNFGHEILHAMPTSTVWTKLEGLENVIEEELLEIEHRLCVKYLHANWSKRFPGK